jgi:hypothetical protein
MPIRFACSCGRTLRVPEQHAGKSAKCPACGAVVKVPEPVEDHGLEVVEAAEEEGQAPAPPEVQPVEPATADDTGSKEARTKAKKKKKRRRVHEEGPLSRMYAAQAEARARHDEAMGRKVGGWGRDEGGGWTMFGVHITKGVLAGTGMVVSGLLCLIVFAILQAQSLIDPRLFIGAIVYTGLGAFTLYRSLVVGEED